MDKFYQRVGADLLPVNLGGSSGGGLAPDALQIDGDGNLVLDTDKAGNVSLTINDGMLEVENG